jgi:hypothetical protein
MTLLVYSNQPHVTSIWAADCWRGRTGACLLVQRAAGRGLAKTRLRAVSGGAPTRPRSAA